MLVLNCGVGGWGDCGCRCVCIQEWVLGLIAHWCVNFRTGGNTTGLWSDRVACGVCACMHVLLA